VGTVWAFFSDRQNVVLVESGRYSRSAKFDTTSELIMFTESAVQYAEQVL